MLLILSIVSNIWTYIWKEIIQGGLDKSCPGWLHLLQWCASKHNILYQCSRLPSVRDFQIFTHLLQEMECDPISPFFVPVLSLLRDILGLGVIGVAGEGTRGCLETLKLSVTSFEAICNSFHLYWVTSRWKPGHWKAPCFVTCSKSLVSQIGTKPSNPLQRSFMYWSSQSL